MRKLAPVAIASALFFSQVVIAQPAKNEKLFTLVPPGVTNISFSNDLVEDEQFLYYKYESLYNGGGVCVGDINNDGLQDIYFSSNMGANRLYQNMGNFIFKDITNQSGVAATGGFKTGVNMVDVNNDGFLDIYVCRSGPVEPKDRKNSLFINNKNGTFTDLAHSYGLDDASYSNQSYFLDFDKDGDLDMFLVNQPRDFATSMQVNVKMENGQLVLIKDTATVHVSHRLYENKGNRFTDITKKAGILTHAFGLSAGISDFNADGWPDIYVANDMKNPDILFINNKNGTFTDRLTEYFNHTSFFSMGSDISDFNNDGLEDVFVVDMSIEDPVRQKQLFMHSLNYDKIQLMRKYGLYFQHARNVLQLNNGNGSYSDIGYYAGVAQTDWSWTPLVADFDNDSWKDMYITNGYMRDVTDWDYKVFVLDSIKNLMAKGIAVRIDEWFNLIPQTKVKNYFYRNNGTLRFEKITDTWNDAPPSFSNSSVYADLDNDGDLDIIVNNMADPAFVFKNNSRELLGTNYIRFRLLRDKSTSIESYGAVVKLYNDKGQIQLQRYDPQRGYLGSVEHFLHFGLGKDATIAKAEIIFPSGKQLNLSNINANQLLTVFEADATLPVTLTTQASGLFKQTTVTTPFRYTHVENDYIDFKREPLIPYKCSRKGPFYTMADVNGDGLEDIFIGGPTGAEGKLMIQSASGSYVEKKVAAIVADKSFEDNGVLFFDADGDKDNDLYVVSGGAEFEAGSPKYQDRLYINDGKGNFTRSLGALPKEASNGSHIIPLDFDEDGDLDLFIGGGVSPGKFPKCDKSLLLQNNKGIFKDVTTTIAPELTYAGIVTYAAWDDIDGDQKKELLITGEWMAPLILKIANGKFLKQSAEVTINSGRTISLDQLTGWWNTLKLADVDDDGDLDILMGNRGDNSRITASIDEPCTVYAKDFDGNGSYDAVLGYYAMGKCRPMFHRDQLIDQMPFFRKKYLRYKHFADQGLDDIFTTEQKRGMDVFKAAFFESGMLINEGNNRFRFVQFPEKTQFSLINDLIVEDFDKDGKKDLLIVGNSFDPDVSTGNYDATAAMLLKNNGSFLQLSPILPNQSGLHLRGEVRRVIYQKEKNRLIFLKNNAAAQVFERGITD